MVGKSLVVTPASSTARPGRNFKLLGLGVSCDWMNIERPSQGTSRLSRVIVSRSSSHVRSVAQSAEEEFHRNADLKNI